MAISKRPSPIRLKYDGSKTVIHQQEVEESELDSETISPWQKAVIQGFQYRNMLESEKVVTVFKLSVKVNQERAFSLQTLSLINLARTSSKPFSTARSPPHLPSPSSAKASPKTGPNSGRCFWGSDFVVL